MFFAAIDRQTFSLSDGVFSEKRSPAEFRWKAALADK
jgi:hypothetical protein